MPNTDAIDHAAAVADWPELTREQSDAIATILRAAQRRRASDGVVADDRKAAA